MFFSEISGNSFTVWFSIYKLLCNYWMSSRNFICILHFSGNEVGIIVKCFHLLVFKTTEHLEPGLFVVFPVNPSTLFSWALFFLTEGLDCSILEQEPAIIFPFKSFYEYLRIKFEASSGKGTVPLLWLQLVSSYIGFCLFTVSGSRYFCFQYLLIM